MWKTLVAVEEPSSRNWLCNMNLEETNAGLFKIPLKQIRREVYVRLCGQGQAATFRVDL